MRREAPCPLGVQVLAGANLEAMAVAHACGAAFVRAEGFVFAHVADEGIIESSAGPAAALPQGHRRGRVRVFVDIKKKHSAHAITSDVDLVETAHAAEFFLADGLIVTGVATGRAADATEVRAVAESAGIPTLVGSGITADNVAQYAAADAYIVGSWLKGGGPLDQPARPRALRRAVRGGRDGSPAGSLAASPPNEVCADPSIAWGGNDPIA